MSLENYNLQELTSKELNTIVGGGFWEDLGRGAGYVVGTFFNALGGAYNVITA